MKLFFAEKSLFRDADVFRITPDFSTKHFKTYSIIIRYVYLIISFG